ncbi:MAG TPA: metallopeptidase family protein [Actinomycetes bacterium]
MRGLRRGRSQPDPEPGRPARRRDRHGRGIRGPLAPASVPYPPTRSERFDDLVLGAVERVEGGFAAELAGVELAVEEVPPPRPGPVPLGRVDPPAGGRPARLVVYRRPVELRSPDVRDRPGLVRDVVVELVADLLGLSPEQVDPDYGDGDGDGD